MPKTFDPYHKWLGIPRSEQPPNHYRLLGISLFESDPDVIDAAANRQMSYLQSCATDPYLQISQDLLNEIAAVRLCLLDPRSKTAYDEKLLSQKQVLVARSTAETTRREPPRTRSSHQETTPNPSPSARPFRSSAFARPLKTLINFYDRLRSDSDEQTETSSMSGKRGGEAAGSAWSAQDAIPTVKYGRIPKWVWPGAATGTLLFCMFLGWVLGAFKVKPPNSQISRQELTNPAKVAVSKGQSPSVSPEGAGFPSIAGVWQEGPEEIQHLVVVAQNADRFAATCTYQHKQYGEIKWVMTGTISKDGEVKGHLVITKAPRGWLDQTRVGKYSALDGTIIGRAEWPGGGEDIEWKLLHSGPTTIVNSSSTKNATVRQGSLRQDRQSELVTKSQAQAQTTLSNRELPPNTLPEASQVAVFRFDGAGSNRELPPNTLPDASPMVMPSRRRTVLGEQVDLAIHNGTRYLEQEQRADGSWDDVSQQAKTGTTSLVTLALLTAGEKPDSPSIRKALAHLRRFGPEDLRSTYAIALQTMVFAAVGPDPRDMVRIAENVSWLESAQIKPPRKPPGCWTYSSSNSTQPGDNSNTQYALLGLNAASEVGVPVKAEVWALARLYWEKTQRRDGGWGYHAGDQFSTSSMTCAGVSSLVITGSKQFRGTEYLQGTLIRNCGQGAASPNLQYAIDWLGANFSVGQNFPMGQQWKHYFLYGLERAGRLAGIRFFGQHDWYRLGAEELVRIQDRLSGFWRGVTEQPVVATSFAILFLAKGRAPVLVNKLRHGPRGDWNNDPDDVRNLVAVVSRDWKNLLTWQVVDPAIASVADLLQAPIVFLNGHKVPEFDAIAKQNLRDYVEHGGFVLADACCSNPDFDKGFRSLMKVIFPLDENELRPLPDDHPIWKVKHRLDPRDQVHPERAYFFQVTPQQSATSRIF